MASFPNFQVKEGEWTSEKFVDVLGLKIPAFFTSDPQLLCDFISNFQTRQDDVFVVSYPKSGTTWVQEVVWQIFNGGEISIKPAFERVPFLEMLTHPRAEHVDINTLPSPRIIKTHLTYHATPKDENEETRCKYIYVARNPKDVDVSRSHWNDHVLGWWKHKDDPNVLFLKFEGLQKDLLSHVRMIANFLNKPLSDNTISHIAKQCTFSGMKKNAASYVMKNEEGEASHLRKGVVGDWKNYFTPELNERFEREVLAKLNGSGLEFDFEK